MESSTALIESNPAASLALVEEMFPLEARKQVAGFLGIVAEDPALPAYLAICAQYRLSPFMGQIWLIESKGRNADGAKLLRPTTGRDGYLAIAQRTPEFLGMKHGVVCAHDHFEVEYRDEADDPKVLHRYASKPTKFGPDEDPRAYRGAILGAWCKVFVRGRFPTFYFADLREHGKVSSGQWSGAWAYTSAMILKAAQSYALRVGIGISGLVPADELAFDPSAAEQHAVVEVDDDPAGVEWPEDEALADRLRSALTRANALEPNAYPTAALQMLVNGRPAEQLEELAARVEDENVERERRAAAAEAAAEEQVTDAEVVEDDPEAELQAHVAADGGVDPDGGFDSPEGETRYDPDAEANAAEEEAKQVRLDDLRRQLAALEDRLRTAGNAEEYDRIEADISTVEGEIRKLAGDSPGQEALGL